MDHIFGDSDDIAFGSTLPIAPSRPSLPLRGDRRMITSHVPVSRISSSPERTARPSRGVAPLRVDTITPSEGITGDTVPALSRLIAGMKSSFLPREDNPVGIRIVGLSDHTATDPLFLVRSDDTTILMGSGFGMITRAGHEYPTFPDMRLIFSEKDRIRAWILTDAHIDVTRFEYILPTLGFPPIYGTRDVIASFRKNITNAKFLESCRFFELFSDGMVSRRIGDIDCIIADVAMTNVLGLRSGGSTVAFANMPVASSDLGASVSLSISSTDQGFFVGNETFVTGEILSLHNAVLSRHAMKFTFDTFFVDGLSIGVVAGYTLGDREQLAENGVLIFTLEEDTRVRTIAGHIFIDSRGFVHAYEMMYIHKELLKGIRSTYEKLLTENPKIERGELVQGLRREITKYCYLLTGRTPLVMPVVIER